MKKNVCSLMVMAMVFILPYFAIGDDQETNSAASKDEETKVVVKDEPIIFPKDGQNREQIVKDKATCKDWANGETGIDPEVLAQKIETINEKATTDNQTKMGGLLEGIFKGAATGAVVGAIDKNIGNAVGSDAVKGAVLGGILKNENQGQKAEELQYRKETIEKEDLQKEYDRYVRAYTVCLEAKGYAVK